MVAQFLKLFFCIGFLVFGFQKIQAQNVTANYNKNILSNDNKAVRFVIYFNPEISPYVAEIKDITFDSFFSEVTNRFAKFRNNRMLRVETPMSYENSDIITIKEICKNNEVDYAVVPKVKFFKVGIAKYVFSSQVVVSMKLYDKHGQLISESSYDTFRRNARILGSAENSIKIGTNGALKGIIKDLKKLKHHKTEGF